MSAEVLFPVTVTFENGETAQYSSVTDLECNLEHFDSTVETRCRVADARGRPVHLKVHLLEVKELRLMPPAVPGGERNGA
jgi:hypothetical protein